MGYLAEKIVEVAADNGVPIYEDNSLATILSQLKLGAADPRSTVPGHSGDLSLFLKFDPSDPEKWRRERAQEKEAVQDGGLEE